MSDGITREPGLRPDPILPEHLLPDEVVDVIVHHLQPMHRAFLVKHMRAAEKAAYDRGLADGMKAVVAP